MPADMIGTLVGARRHMQASYYLKQAVSALLDIRIHTAAVDAPVEPTHITKMYLDMKLQYEAMDIPDDSLFPAGWSHMADYDAGYYGYLWSKVYALDMYSKFATNPLDPMVGAEFRKKVLDPGSSRTELDLVRDFLGREPSEAPFLAALGIGE